MHTEIYGNEPSRRRECLYYLAVGHYKMDEYEKAKQFNSTYIPSLPPIYSQPIDTIFLTSRLDNITYHLPPTTALLLEKEPTNLQAQSLAEQIDEKITREEYIGMGIVAGIAAASAIVVATIIRRATRD